METLKPSTGNIKQEVVNLFDDVVKVPDTSIRQLKGIKGEIPNEEMVKLRKEFVNGLMSESTETRLVDTLKIEDSDTETQVKKFILPTGSLIVMYGYYNTPPVQKYFPGGEGLYKFLDNLHTMTGAQLRMCRAVV